MRRTVLLLIFCARTTDSDLRSGILLIFCEGTASDDLQSGLLLRFVKEPRMVIYGMDFY